MKSFQRLNKKLYAKLGTRFFRIEGTERKRMEERRIERRTASMLKRNYTTKPHPQGYLDCSLVNIIAFYCVRQ
jgi:hypothetical protein